MKEKDLYKLLKRNIPGEMSRIENIADEGTPDITACMHGYDYWIELKVDETETIDKRKLMRPSQKAWHLSRARAGSKIFVVIQYNISKRIDVLYVVNCEYLYANIWSMERPYNWKGLYERIYGILNGSLQIKLINET